MNPDKRRRVVGLDLDHFHMGDLLRMVFEHPRAEIVGIWDCRPERMQEAIRHFRLPPERVFTDPRTCLESTRPDLVIHCPAAAEHAEWTELVAEYRRPVLIENNLSPPRWPRPTG